MALETIVFKQGPYDFGQKEIHKIGGLDSFGQGCIQKERKPKHEEFDQNNGILETGGNSSPDVCGRCDRTVTGAGGVLPMPMTPSAASFRKKRRRPKSPKNVEDMENQRMTHIAVERNRRRQMNHYLSVLRSLMPPSYSQRGDQASIVGGAINFVKELGQQLQFLEANNQKSNGSNIRSKLFTNFFTFPQYSTSPIQQLHGIFSNEPPQKLSTIADVEVTVAESHANVKILTKKRPNQLVIIVTGLYSFSLPILHLSITTVDPMVLYSFIVKVNDDSQLNSVNDIATAVHGLVGTIKDEASC